MAWCLVKHRDNFIFTLFVGYGLDDKMIRVLFPGGSRNSSLRYRVHSDSGAHPASHPMGVGNFFTGCKAAAGALS